MPRNSTSVPAVAGLMVALALPALAQQKRIRAAEARDHTCEEVTVCWGLSHSLDGLSLALADSVQEKYPYLLMQFLETAEDKQFCATGVITEREGLLEIEVKEPEQLLLESVTREDSRVETEYAGCESEHGMSDSLVLTSNTAVPLELKETVTSERERIVQGIPLAVVREVKVKGLVVIPQGAYAWGSVEIKGRANFDRPGRIRLSINGVYALSGDKVSLRAVEHVHGQTSCECFELGCLVCAATLPFTKGTDAVLSKGRKVCAYVDSDVSFDAELIRELNAELMIQSSQEDSPN